jgi:hypothetical protein
MGREATRSGMHGGKRSKKLIEGVRLLLLAPLASEYDTEQIAANRGILSPSNLLCYQHYQRCKFVGLWPGDPLVQYHARVIQRVEQECSEIRQVKMLQRLFGST